MNTEIMKSEVAGELEPVRNPSNLLEIAVSRGAGLEELRQLMDMQEKFEANQARKAFFRAMADFKNESIVIAKDKDNKQYGSKYTSMGELVNTVTPVLGKHGLSADWTLDQSEGIRVGCTLTHALGHSGETKWMKVPVDNSGQKNPIQQIKSSVTYARILTFEMACGLASREGALDDDGNGSGKSEGEGMEQGEFDRLCGLIDNAGSLESLKSIYLASCQDANALKDQGAIATFAKLKDKRYKELAPKVGAK